MAVSQSITLTQGTQSIEKNTTQVTFKWTSTQTGESWNGYTKTAYYYVSINGGAEVKYSVSYTLPKGTTTTIASKTFNVTHNDDGTGSITIRTWMDTGISAGTIEKSKSLTLKTIPRATVINSVSCNTSYFDGTLTYKYTPQSASYYNKCNISLNVDGDFISIKSITLGKKSASQQTATVTLSSSELTTVYKNLPTTTQGILRFTFRTYSDSDYSTQVGSAGYKEITLTIPASVVPVIGEVELNPVDITTKDGTLRNILVQGKNKLQIIVRDCKAGSGSTIKSYTFSGPNVSATTKTSTDASYTFTSSSTISNTGTLTYTVKLIDQRGRSATKTANITCYAYSTPTITSFSVYRCNSKGTADDNGSYIKYSLKTNYASVNSTNNTTVKIYYKVSTASSWTAGANALTNSTSKSASALVASSSGSAKTFDLSYTYNVYASITDNYGGSNKSSTEIVFSSERILNIRPKGKGIAFGKMAESDDLFESKWPMKVNDTITFGEGVQGSLYTGQNEDGVNIVYLKTGQSTSAGQWAGIALHNSSLYVPNAGNNGIVNLGSSGRKWNQLYAANGTIETSDKNMKKDIEDMSDAQEQLFNQLKPVTYKMIDGTSDRTHYGFISQDVEDALLEIGLEGKDFAGFCKDAQVDDNGHRIVDENGDVVYDYSLRYSEFIALNTYMIQKLQNEIAELKEEIKQLKSTTQN